MAEQLAQNAPLVFQCAPDVVWVSTPGGIRVEAVEREVGEVVVEVV